MTPMGEAVDILGQALLRFAPQQRWFPPDRPFAAAEEIWFEIPSEHRPAEQKLVVRPRGAGDIQIEYHDAQKQDSPFEILLLGIATPRECAERAAQVVADLTAERLVLAYKKGVLSGGRQFLRPGDLTERVRRRFDWVASWRGFYDWKT